MGIINAKLDAEFEKSAKQSLHFTVTFSLITFLHEFFCYFFNRFDISIKFGFLYPIQIPDRLSGVKIMKTQAINNLTL
jgi:hypothetical protein